MTDDLREVELGAEVVGLQEADLLLGVGVRVGPSAKRQGVVGLAKNLAQLPGVLDAARRANRLVAAKHDEGGKAALPGPLRVRQAVLHRVFRRHERHDALTRNVVLEVRHQMAKVVFLLCADGTIGQEDVGAFPGQPANCVVSVDPRVHAFGRRQFRTRRPELRREHRRTGAQGGEEVHCSEGRKGGRAGKMGRPGTRGSRPS